MGRFSTLERPSPQQNGTVDLQRLIDESATFHVLVVRSSGGGTVVRRGADVVGFEATQPIYRLSLALDLPGSAGVTGSNLVGEQAGEAHLRWIVVDRPFVATPGRPPAGVAVDHSRSQRFVMQEATFRFAGGHALRAFGTGRTFPMSDDRGAPRLAVAAVGEIVDGAGSFRDRPGNLTLSGEVAEDGAFTGHVMIRMLDVDGLLRRDAVSEARDIGPQEEGITYLTWIAQKSKSPDQENTFSLTPAGRPRGLNIPVELRRVFTDFSSEDGFRVSRLETRDVIGREIGFGREARPRSPGAGTPATPFQFEGVSRYSFYGPRGETVGTLTANVLEGRSIQVALPGATDAPGLRFGYFGPIVCGTGCFANVNGMLYGTAGSVFAPPPAPHIISNLYIARLYDSTSRWKSPSAPRPEKIRLAQPHPQRRPDPLFLPLIERKDSFVDTHKRWRAGVTACADRFAAFIAETYNGYRHMGEFTGWEIDPDKLRDIFHAGGVKPFDEATFNRYAGRARGVFRTYRHDDREEIASAPLYSYWDPVNFTRPDGRIYKQIVGSNTGYYQPDRLPPLSDGHVDLLVNSWRADVGVTSWIDIHQERRHLRTSFAYKLPGKDEILWFVKDLWIAGQEIRNNVFMASHEWKEVQDGKVRYLMVAIFFDMDFDRRRISVHGDTFWRVRYEEQ
jgi:hypothetical protein